MSLCQEQQPIDESCPKPRQHRKPLPDQLSKLTREAAASSLRYRYERDPVLASRTHNVSVKVAYAMQLPQEVVSFKSLTRDQLRQLCHHLGIRLVGFVRKFTYQRALYAVFSNDNVDRSLIRFLSDQTSVTSTAHVDESAPPLRSRTTTPMAHAANTSVQPCDRAGTLDASAMRPFPTEKQTGTPNAVEDGTSAKPPIQAAKSMGTTAANNGASGPQRTSVVRIKVDPPGDTYTSVESLSPRNSNGSSHTEVETPVPHFYAVRIKQEAQHAADSGIAVHEPLLSVHRLTDPSETNVADRLDLIFQAERTGKGCANPEVDSSPVHPWLLMVNNTNDSAHDGAVIVPPLPPEDTRDSRDPMETEPSVHELSPSETSHGSFDRGLVAVNSSIPNDAAEPSSPPQVVPDQKASLQSLDQLPRHGIEATEAKGMFKYFKQNMDEDHEIKKEDISLRKEDLALRKQDLELTRKRNLYDAMNQILQNYMNPACPPEIKDALLEQWKRMDVEFKSI